jgi:hypothetical protein
MVEWAYHAIVDESSWASRVEGKAARGDAGRPNAVVCFTPDC